MEARSGYSSNEYKNNIVEYRTGSVVRSTTEKMNPGNESIKTETTQSFQCCCSISRTAFDVDGQGVIQIINCIFTAPTLISATLGNLLVLISIWRTPALHSPSNVLLVGLALSDLGVGLIVQPVFLAFSIAKFKGLPNVFCGSIEALSISGAWLCMVSLLNMTAISLDMYIALYLHLRYKQIVTVKRATAILVGIWLVSFACGMLYLWCNRLSWIPLMSAVLLCLVVTASAYYKVLQIVRRHRALIVVRMQVGLTEIQEENPMNMAEHRKSLVNMFLIYCLFVFCYLPSFVMFGVVVSTGRTVLKQSLLELSLITAYLNSTLNPFVYCWRLKTIRVAVIETINKIFRRNYQQ